MSTSYPPQPWLPSLLQTALYQRFWPWVLPALARVYGDTFALRVPPFGDRLVVFRRPAHIKEIFALDASEAHAGEGNAFAEPMLGTHTVALADEAEHARLRRLLMPALRGSALRGYRSIVEHIVRAEADRWETRTEVLALDAMNTVTSEVMMQVVLGVTDLQMEDKLAPKLDRMLNLTKVDLLRWVEPKLGRFGPWKPYVRNQAEVNELIFEEIAARRQATNLDQRSDVLSRLLQVRAEAGDEPLTDEELRGQLVNLLLGGQESSSIAMAWTLYELAKNPALQDQARKAANDNDDKFLEATLKESMRLHTVFPAAARKLTRQCEIGGWLLPAGTMVYASISLAHRDPDNFPDALVYRPSRFLNDEVKPNTWLPFGGGARRCAGAGFILMEGVVVLREMLKRYDMSLPAKGRLEGSKISTLANHPSRRARIVVRPRYPADAQRTALVP
jgi:cytochrome P450